MKNKVCSKPINSAHQHRGQDGYQVCENYQQCWPSTPSDVNIPVLPLGTKIKMKTTKTRISGYSGLSAVIIGLSIYDPTVYRVRFTPPAPRQPETDYVQLNQFTYPKEEAPMPETEKKNFEIRINMPEDIVAFFEKFQEQGNLRYEPGDKHATFELEEDDMWDAANTVQDVVREANAMHASFGVNAASFDKAKEVESFPRKSYSPTAG